MYINSIGRGSRVVLIALAVMFVSAGIAQATAATTIGANIVTTGTLGVTGLSSLGQASSTMLSANTAYFGASATSTFSGVGALDLAGALTGTTGSFTSTLGVTGLSSLGKATSTMLSAYSAYFGASATSTFSSAGALALAGALTGTTGSFNSTLGATGAVSLGNTLGVTASTTVGTATFFAGPDMNYVGVGTTSPRTLFQVENQTATTTIVISSGAAAKGGRIILEDIDGAGCTEVSALNGALTAIVVTCPTGI